MSPVCSTSAGLCGSALTFATASCSVAVTSLFASLLKPMWLSLICDEEDALALGVGEVGQPAHREGRREFRPHSPDRRRASPCHAAEKPAPIDAVVALVDR